jgi:5-hydroxyisourate hydrolase
VTLSTHVLDTARGEPAAGVPVRLERDGATVAESVTDAGGRVRDLGPVTAGCYRLVFDTAAYLGPGAFFPSVSVDFAVEVADRHYHVPLLLSPFGYSTYRGS